MTSVKKPKKCLDIGCNKCIFVVNCKLKGCVSLNSKVVISADSTCDLSNEILDKYGIPICPLFVVMNDRPLRDGIDTKPQDVFDYTEQTGKLAKTTAPNVADYTDFFREITSEGQSVVHFSISAPMSVSYSNACTAAADFENVHIIDSMNLSTGIGLLVLKACDLSAQGLSAAEIADKINDLREYVDATFVIDTLKYLHKGGRCSAVAALGANLLKLKPCIEVRDGKMAVGKKYRGKSPDVLEKYVAEMLANIDDIDLDRVFVTHTCDDTALVDAVKAQVKSIGGFKEVLETRAGCTISVHCGPGTLGILFVRKTKLK